ncbi:MAG TPA: DUF4412 domain-containing protein [Thermoanaerobaculia bacterium]|nr:DUF4412 domain-containing protein [Thermoanaerobaculia bacterium]
MKTVLAVALALLPLSLEGGLTYQFEARTTGVQQTRLAGAVEAEGGRFRIDFRNGDGMLFRNNTYAVTSGSDRVVRVADPATKTYFELNLDQLLGGGAGLGQLSDFVKITVDNQRVTTRDEGSGEKIEGYPTRRIVVEASSVVNLDMSGQKSSMNISLRTESWTTDRISADFISFLHRQGSRTGIAGLDKLLEAQTKAAAGFPLKQVTTLRAVQNGMEVVTTTSASISKIASRSVPASRFVIPSDYRKVANPIEKLRQR